MELSLSLKIWFFVVGLCVGSFLNVVIYRIPLGFSTRIPSRSACRNCKRKLTWSENIPVLSFLILRGKCRGCGSIIGWRYPIVEILNGVLYLSIALNFGMNFSTFYYCYLASVLLALTFIDFDHRIIPDVISKPSIAIGLLLSPLVDGLGVSNSALGVLFGGGFFWGLAWIYEKFTKREGLGFGDVKMLALIGSFIGPQGVLSTILISSVTGSVFGLVAMIAQRKTLRLALPFGPFLAIGALLYLFWGDYFIYRFYS